MNLAHYTINTGHTRLSPAEEVSDQTLNMLFPLISTGGGQLPDPFGKYRVTIVKTPGGATFDISNTDPSSPTPLVLCALCWSAGAAPAIWKEIEKAYLNLTDIHLDLIGKAVPRIPQHIPWLTVLTFPFCMLFLDSVTWLADLERCLAWAIMRNPNSDTCRLKRPCPL